MKRKIKRVSPKLTESENPGNKEIELALATLYSKKAFLPVSLSSPYFLENSENKDLWRIDTLLKWVSSTFGTCDFIVADELYRHNLEFVEDKLYGDISQLAQIGNQISSNILHVAREINQIDLISTFNWKEYLDSNGFEHAKQAVHKVYNSNEEFSDQIKELATQYFFRNDISLIKSRFLSAIEFLLEELAVFTLLGNDGYEAMIYPNYLPELFFNTQEIFRNDKILSGYSKLTLVEIKYT